MDLSLEEQVFGCKLVTPKHKRPDWDWLKHRVKNAGLSPDWLTARMTELHMPKPVFDADDIWTNAMPPLITAIWEKIGEAERFKMEALKRRDTAYLDDELYSVEALTNPIYRAEVLKCLFT